MDKSEGKKIFSKTVESLTEKVAKAYYKFEKGVSISSLKKQKKERIKQLGIKLLELIEKGEDINREFFKHEYECIKNIDNNINKMQEERDNYEHHYKKSKTYHKHGHKHGHNYDVSSLSKHKSCTCSGEKGEENITCCSSYSIENGEDVIDSKCCLSNSKDKSEASDNILHSESSANILENTSSDVVDSYEEKIDTRDK